MGNLRIGGFLRVVLVVRVLLKVGGHRGEGHRLDLHCCAVHLNREGDSLAGVDAAGEVLEVELFVPVLSLQLRDVKDGLHLARGIRVSDSVDLELASDADQFFPVVLIAVLVAEQSVLEPLGICLVKDVHDLVNVKVLGRGVFDRGVPNRGIAGVLEVGKLGVGVRPVDGFSLLRLVGEVEPIGGVQHLTRSGFGLGPVAALPQDDVRDRVNVEVCRDVGETLAAHGKRHHVDALGARLDLLAVLTVLAVQGDHAGTGVDVGQRFTETGRPVPGGAVNVGDVVDEHTALTGDTNELAFGVVRVIVEGGFSTGGVRPAVDIGRDDAVDVVGRIDVEVDRVRLNVRGRVRRGVLQLVDVVEVLEAIPHRHRGRSAVRRKRGELRLPLKVSSDDLDVGINVVAAKSLPTLAFTVVLLVGHVTVDVERGSLRDAAERTVSTVVVGAEEQVECRVHASFKIAYVFKNDFAALGDSSIWSSPAAAGADATLETHSRGRCIAVHDSPTTVTVGLQGRHEQSHGNLVCRTGRVTGHESVVQPRFLRGGHNYRFGGEEARAALHHGSVEGYRGGSPCVCSRQVTCGDHVCRCNGHGEQTRHHSSEDPCELHEWPSHKLHMTKCAQITDGPNLSPLGKNMLIYE